MRLRNDVKSMLIKIGWTRCRSRHHEDCAKKQADRPDRCKTAIKRTEIPESSVQRVVKRHVLTSQIVQESMDVHKLNSLVERIASLCIRNERCQRFKRHRKQGTWGCKGSIHLGCKETMKVPQVQFSGMIAENKVHVRDDHDLLTSSRPTAQGLVFGSRGRQRAVMKRPEKGDA